MDIGELRSAANDALESATYAPYSRIRFGAALETQDGKIFTGGTIENASYGLSVCAERVAMFKAVSAGYKRFKRMYIASGFNEPIWPCGACVQVMLEFNPYMDIYIKGYEKPVIAGSLLPYRFTTDMQSGVDQQSD